jgi:REP element-mobilizing transposase RayT
MKGYDYSREGAYFITLVTKDRVNRFGEIVNEEMILNEVGEIAKKVWLQTPIIRNNIILGEFIIMPDHIHGILIITSTPNEGANDEGANCNSPHSYSPHSYSPHSYSPQKFQSPSKTIGAIIRGFKGSATKQINELYISKMVYDSPQKIFQRDYIDKIITDKEAFQNISNYIINNPKNWGKPKTKQL